MKKIETLEQALAYCNDKIADAGHSIYDDDFRQKVALAISAISENHNFFVSNPVLLNGLQTQIQLLINVAMVSHQEKAW